MTKKAKPVNFASFTKAELIRTIKRLDKRQTQLLNELAQAKAACVHNAKLALGEVSGFIEDAGVVHVTQEPEGEVIHGVRFMPWQLPNPYGGDK